MARDKNLAAAPSGAGGLASDFTQSLDYDRRLYREELAVSSAHVRMLARQGIIPAAAADKIVGALGEIKAEIEADKFRWRAELEDIHMNVESRLYELLGDTAGLLHTARSRNDLIATDTRLWVMRTARAAQAAVHQLQSALVQVAEQHTETLLPAYTHLQRGQAVVLAHHLLAYYEMLARDWQRFAAAYDSADELPLGSGAATGTPYEIARDFVAGELGFSRTSANSIDAVSNRDYIVDFVYAGTLCMTHLSRLGEELVLWSSAEFDFVRLDDKYTTGSSIMPQKRNPDFAELVRGRSGTAIGALVNILTMLKGLPLTYNRDLQDDKQALFSVSDTLLPCLGAMAGMLSTLTVNARAMRAALDDNAILATDVADYLAKKGLPFREAYAKVQNLVALAAERGCGLQSLSLADYQAQSELFTDDVFQLSVAGAVNARTVRGGTAPSAVRDALGAAQAELARRGSAD